GAPPALVGRSSRATCRCAPRPQARAPPAWASWAAPTLAPSPGARSVPARLRVHQALQQGRAGRPRPGRPGRGAVPGGRPGRAEPGGGPSKRSALPCPPHGGDGRVEAGDDVRVRDLRIVVGLSDAGPEARYRRVLEGAEAGWVDGDAGHARERPARAPATGTIVERRAPYPVGRLAAVGRFQPSRGRRARPAC